MSRTNLQLSGDELLDRLEDSFLAHGYRNVTFRSLAMDLGCSNRRLYEVAPSKEALFLTVIARFFTRVKKAGWEKAKGEAPLIERIRDYLRVGIQAAQRAGPQFNADIEAIEAGRVLFDEFQRDRIDGLEALIQEGIDAGDFGPFHAHLVAEVMVQSARRLRDPAFLSRSGLTFAEALTELSKLLRNGLLRR